MLSYFLFSKNRIPLECRNYTQSTVHEVSSKFSIDAEIRNTILELKSI